MKSILNVIQALGNAKKIAVLTLLLSSFFASAQDANVIAAFAESYTFETNTQYAKAIESITKVYKADSYEMNIRLGWLNYMLGQQTEAVSYYQKAIALKPMSEEARLGLVLPASLLGNWDQVIQTYKKILELDPANSTVNYRLGVIYYTRKEYATAESYLQKVVNLYPFGYDALLMLAWTYYQTGKLREAKVLFNKVLMLSPNDSSALEGLSLIK
jgi:tetratricopeptide (TPR) repeat protein